MAWENIIKLNIKLNPYNNATIIPNRIISCILIPLSKPLAIRFVIFLTCSGAITVSTVAATENPIATQIGNQYFLQYTTNCAIVFQKCAALSPPALFFPCIILFSPIAPQLGFSNFNINRTIFH